MTTPFGRSSGTRYGTASGRVIAESTFEESMARLDALAMLLDSAIRIPGTKIVMGLDALLGLVPIIGDAISGLISSYIIFEARRLGAPRWLIARMAANTTLDPDERTLLQVKVGDVAEADEIFAKLMGDIVEPRREFIQENALNVSNLDV